jgi:hypothetical protein
MIRRRVGQGDAMTSRELAEEFTEIWDELGTGDINEMLAKNIGFDLLEFFVAYARQFAQDERGNDLDPKELRGRLPNLLVIGYLIRLLEERVD